MAQYSLWSAAAPSLPASLSGQNVMGHEFGVTSSCAMVRMAIYRDTTGNPTSGSTFDATLYEVTGTTTGTEVTGARVTGVSAATGNGWKNATPASPVTLTVGKRYQVVVRASALSYNGGYWSTGAGASNLVRGPITFYSQANATGSIQGKLNAGGSALAFPTAQSGSGGRMWAIDVVVDDTLGATAATPNAFMPFFNF